MLVLVMYKCRTISNSTVSFSHIVRVKLYSYRTSFLVRICRIICYRKISNIYSNMEGYVISQLVWASERLYFAFVNVRPLVGGVVHFVYVVPQINVLDAPVKSTGKLPERSIANIFVRKSTWKWFDNYLHVILC